MKTKQLSLIFLFLTVFSCKEVKVSSQPSEESAENKSSIFEKEIEGNLIFPKEFITNSFDFPVGKPNGKGYYNAQDFKKNGHLGDDWNAVTGGNSDLGDPIFAIGNGYVKFAADVGGGWGNVIRIIHQLPNGQRYESLYAHCDEILVKAQKWVVKGQKIGTIGTANGTYLAHLHFEIRDDIALPIGGGYGVEFEGYLNPTHFIEENRIFIKREN